MYKSFSASEYRELLGFPKDYSVRGMLTYGTYANHPYGQFEATLKKLGVNYTVQKLDHEFFGSLKEYTVNNKKYWISINYGSALLSEYLHLACLFGSKTNLFIGSCGGLSKTGNSHDIIIPEWSFAKESSAKAYASDASNKYYPNKTLSQRLVKTLSKNNVVHKGPIITFQAMMGETWESITKWSEQGYIGVEMEAATVFAVSKHFKVPSTAILFIADNLIRKETVLSKEFEKTKNKRRNITDEIFEAATEELIN